MQAALDAAHDYPDKEDKEQLVGELSAGRLLLPSVRVRVTAILTVIGAGPTWRASQFAGRITGNFAEIAWGVMKSLSGVWSHDEDGLGY